MQKTSTHTVLLRTKLLLLLLSLHALDANAQWTTPTIDGTFDGSEVYPNSLSSDGRTWYVTWDNTNLYVFVQGAGGSNRVLMYFDTNPSIPVNGGANGSVVGINYSNTNLVQLPFSAEAFVALETGYRQLNTCFTGTSFLGPINVTSATGWAFAASGSGNDFEAQIPWNAINNGSGRPAAFNWFGYITDNNTGGNYFSKVPTANPGGVLGTTLPNGTNTQGYERYFKITNTENTTSTNPFSLDCYTFVRHTGVDADPFGSITVEDFTMNTAGRSIVRASDGSDWTINGTLRVANGTVDFGSNTGTCVVNGDSVVVGASGTLTLSGHPNTLTVNGNLKVDGTFNAPANSTVTFSGSSAQSVSGTASSITFHNIVVSKAESRTELIVFPSTSLTYYNPLHFGHGTMTVNGNFTLDSGLVYLSPTSGSGTFTRTIQDSVILGSTPSSIFGTGISGNPIRANTVFIVNNLAGATVNTTINGDISPGSSGSGYVTLILAGKDCNSSSSSTLTVNGKIGDFTTSTRPISLNGNGTTPPSGVGTMTMNFNGDITITNPASIFNGDRAGTLSPSITFGGSSSSTINIAPVVFLGGGPTTGGTNAQANWTVASGKTITIPSTGALAVNMGRTLTVNGTLICADGAQLIGTATGPSSGSPTLTMGTNGVIRVADVDGLGDGTLLDPSSNFPLFIRRTAPSSGTPTNWVISSINSNGTIEYSGTGQTVTPRNTSSNYFKLAFSGTGAKTLGGSVDVADSLALNGGVVSTGSNVLRVNNTAAGIVTRTAGHINGRLQRAYPNSPSTSLFFPVGDATTYRPISLEAGTGAIVPLEVQLVSGNANTLGGVDSPLQLVSNVRYYELTNNSGTDNISIAQVEDMQVSSDDGVTNSSLIRVATRTTGNWISQGGSISSVPSLITSSLFSEALTPSSKLFVAIGSETTDNPLPVELLSFTGTSTAQGVKLAWETASESESNGFTVLRRKQGESEWTEVASYQSDAGLRAQNSLNGASYSYTDNALLEVDKVYEYQLRETGFDGQVTTLQTLTLTIRFNVARAFELAQNYPNPFNPTTTIRYQIPTAETVSLKVYDVLGKEVATLVNGRQEAGSYTVPFNAARLASGVYFYRLQAGGFVETKKMLLVK